GFREQIAEVHKRRLVSPHSPLPEETKPLRKVLLKSKCLRFADRLRAFLPLLGERAGVRVNLRAELLKLLNFTIRSRNWDFPLCASPASAASGLSVLLVIVWCTGCAVGPNYKRPTIDSPGTFRAENQATNTPSPELTWWEVYKDENL